MFDPDRNVIAFRPRHGAPQHTTRTLMERVYAAGSLHVLAEDRATKGAAVILQALGFLVIEVIMADGTTQPLKRGEARRMMGRPWRLAKPGFSGMAGLPDGSGPAPG